MSWFLTILFLSLTFGTNFSEANHDNKKLLPSPVVVGTVYCDTCFQQAFSLNSHFISGASIAVECKIGKTKPRFYKEVKTNEHGEFKVKLPFLVKKHVKRIKGCNFKLLSSNEPNCAIASTSTSSSLSLKKKLQQEHIFSAGIFSFKPIKKPKFCDKKHSIHNLKKQHSYVKNLEQSKFSSKNKVPNEVEDFFFFPPNPFFPPPIIPNPLQPPPLIPNPLQPPPLIPNPFQPPSPPLIPNPFQPPSPPLIPNPFQPPPSNPPLIPNPFQPPPASPPPLIPNPFQPPPSSPPPSFPFPPIVIPGLTPSPPPPPPPKSIFPAPLLPFPPLFPPPLSPGSPPTSSSNFSP
ncbi:adhesive plaque matrix protein [Medicago truncatula]|uniref:Pollen Ole e I family allergen n=1 Tax=Medicago truncatula TaxID=3880 RepID=A0A072U645_MEDTR|nr:adhesive plaque matrix protein [Medicago truncatula]KEH25152.1 pollen Ole e I family allergen [Medicago truncatula]